MKESTLYTCGAQNSALSNPPIESVYTLWYARRRGADGFLRWALDAFNADPLNSSDHRLFAAGDIYMIYPDVKDTKNPTAHSSARFEKLAEGVRDIAKFNWLMENYPDYEKSLNRVLEAIGGDLHATVTTAQKKVNEIGREVAVAELIRAAEASELAKDPAVKEALAAARAALDKTVPVADELTEAAYGLAKALRALSAPEETQPDTETPAETEGNTPETAPEENDSELAETDPPKKGCGSVLTPGAVTAAVTAVVALKKRKED